MLRVGQKVVCIDDKGQTRAPFVVKNVVYTISNIYRSLFRRWEMLEFVEVPRPPGCPANVGFPAHFFRPVVERKTDISVFEALLRQEDIKEKV